MHLHTRLGLLLVFLLICTGTGMSSAEELPGYLMFIQGGESNLSLGGNDSLRLSISDVIPYSVKTAKNQTHLIPLGKTSPFILPIDIALVLNGAGNETVHIVQIESWSFDPEQKSLTIDIIPQTFYEGEGLKAFAEGKQDLSIEHFGTNTETALYVWSTERAENTGDFYQCCQHYCKNSCFDDLNDGTCVPQCMDVCMEQKCIGYWDE